MKTITIIRKETTTNEYGQPVATEKRESYYLDDIDVQPLDLNIDGVMIDEATGMVKRSFYQLFLKKPLEEMPIGLGEEIEFDGKKMKVADVILYDNHSEVTLVYDR
jgi:hypothetical protein